jgi:alpha-tubulin suppressor-like RCC1 family protein
VKLRARSTGFQLWALATAAVLGMALVMSVAPAAAKAADSDSHTTADSTDTTDSPDTISAASTGAAADIAVGSNFVCGATQKGHVSCWGNNQYGQLGNDKSGNVEPYPVRVKGGAQGGKWLTGVTQLAAGGDHMCALTNDDSLFCWGRNNRGQLGTGSQQDAAKPKKVDLPGVTSIAAVAAGLKNTCAIAGEAIAGEKAYC